MTTINIGAGHQESERHLDVDAPSEKTGMVIDVGDSYDRARLEAKVRIGEALPHQQSSPMDLVKSSEASRRAKASAGRTLCARTILLLVSSLATAVSYAIIANHLPPALVPLVLLISVGTLYLFALFLVPSENSSGMRSFAMVFELIIKTALPGASKGEAERGRGND